MADLHQIDELMWPVSTVARLSPSVVSSLEFAGLRFRRSTDHEGARWAAVVVDDGDEVVIVHYAADPTRPVELQSSWQEERSPSQVVGSFLARAGLNESVVEWIAPEWPRS